MFDRILSVLITVAAIAIAAALVHREFVRGPAVAVEGGEPVEIADWQSLEAVGHWIGPSDAPVRLVEFADLECPFCRRFHQAFSEVRSEVGDAVSLLYVHYPLASHRFALPSARAAECAAIQGAFAQFVDAVFRGQDSLGLKTFGSFARDAGIPDLDRFESCTAEQSATFERIDGGREAGERLGVSGTPTVIVNGWQHPRPPTAQELRQLVDSILDERAAGRGAGS